MIGWLQDETCLRDMLDWKHQPLYFIFMFSQSNSLTWLLSSMKTFLTQVLASCLIFDQTDFKVQASKCESLNMGWYHWGEFLVCSLFVKHFVTDLSPRTATNWCESSGKFIDLNEFILICGVGTFYRSLSDMKRNNFRTYTIRGAAHGLLT